MANRCQVWSRASHHLFPAPARRLVGRVGRHVRVLIGGIVLICMNWGRLVVARGSFYFQCGQMCLAKKADSQYTDAHAARTGRACVDVLERCVLTTGVYEPKIIHDLMTCTEKHITTGIDNIEVISLRDILCALFCLHTRKL